MEALHVAAQAIDAGDDVFETYCVASYNSYTAEQKIEQDRQLARAATCWIQMGNPRSRDIILGAPPGCRIVRLPPANFSALWPCGVLDPLTLPEPDHPFGRYPYGDAIIIDMTDDPTVRSDNAAICYADRLWSARASITARIEHDDRLRLARDQSVDIPLHGFVNDLMRRQQSHFAYNHPSSALLDHLFGACCRLTPILRDGVDDLVRRASAYFAMTEPFNSMSVPIAEQMFDLLDVRWRPRDGSYLYQGRQVTQEDYVADYLDFRRQRTRALAA